MRILQWFRSLIERRNSFAVQLNGHTRSGQRVGPGAPSPLNAPARPMPAAALMAMVDTLTRARVLTSIESFNARTRIMGGE